MTRDEFDDLVGAWALGALEEDEQVEFERYLTTDMLAKRDAERFRNTAAMLSCLRTKDLHE